MSPKAFKSAQERLGWSGSRLASELGVTPEHISRMRSGTTPISRVTELAILALAAGWRPE